MKFVAFCLLVLLLVGCDESPQTFVEGYYTTASGSGSIDSGWDFEFSSGTFRIHQASDPEKPLAGRYELDGSKLRLTFDKNPGFKLKPLHWRIVDGVHLLLNDAAVNELDVHHHLIDSSDYADPNFVSCYYILTTKGSHGYPEEGWWQPLLKKHQQFAALLPERRRKAKY